MYRFGDSTAFPLEENFLDTLVTAVDCCVELLEAETEVEAADSSARDARRAASEELQRLDALASRVEGATTTARGSASPSDKVAQRIGDTARELIRKARAEVVRRRDREVAGARVANLSAAIRRPLTRLLLCRQLPRSEWSWRWQVGDDGRGRADLRVIAGDLLATFSARGADDSQWAGPIPVAEVAAGLRMTLPSPPRRRRQRAEPELLDGYEICAVDSTRSRQQLVLRPIKGRGRLLLSLRDPEASGAYAARLSDDEQVLGRVHELSRVDADALATLWAQIASAAPALIGARSELLTASLGGRSIDLVERPGPIAEAILGMLAPLVREMRLRSRVPGELIIKRDLGGARREEIFVSRAALRARFADLPAHHQQLFEAMGLGSESTTELRTQAGLSQARERRVHRASKRRIPLPGVPDSNDEIAAVSLLASSLSTAESYGFSPRPPVQQETSDTETTEAA